ncbi:YfjI family protein [Escherichia coli]|uniref:YfjI family protein n=1 Tax=Escherichia coli TaxID=562 RepID=UPI0015E97459|nr:YfjI family protein [Escherichia coli]EJV4896904.1 DUF3987 domain-containing protein [Escherichia coli]MBA8194057.1 DUF3987 domain-containing protein [Escherichia coli]MBA8246435.1 DUF3987 domain-containing protein [Escherichia coli]MCQ1705506.1 YfjI family protein [Escherichia coli]MEB6351180.1 YfjI family protein [Escherichia coli]
MYTTIANNEYPSQHFPKGLRDVAQDITDITQAPVELIMGTCLSAMSLASQALVTFQHKDGRRSPVSLYNVIIAESGERKTAVFNLVMKPILEFEKQALKAYSEKVRVYEADLLAWQEINKSILSLIRKNEKKGVDSTRERERLREHYLEKPESPRLPKLIYNDATHEAIVKGLSENIGSAGLVSDEGGGVLNGRAMNNSPLFNQLWDGVPFDVERKNHRLVIDDSRFIILILTQLNELNSFIKKRGERAMGNGFFARCLWSVTTTTQGTRQASSEAKCDGQYLEEFHQRISELLELTISNVSPKILRFSPDAEKLFSEFQSKVENQIATDKNKHNALAGILSKVPENTARLAALIHFFLEMEGDEIDRRVLENIIPVINYYYNQVVRVLTVRMDKGEEDATLLYQWLLYGPLNQTSICIDVAKTQVRRYAPYQLRDGARLNRALKLLEEHGNISMYKIRNTNGSIQQIIRIHRS